MILKSCIEQLMRGENLQYNVCQQVLDEMLDPTINPLQIAAFLVLLRAKQETADELAAIVNALRKKMISVPTCHTVLDIVGTGGDRSNTVNISTGSAILVASCGIKVAKHGNRSVSSLTGSADVLEALGINIHLTPYLIAKSIEKVGIGFCYSPNFHPMTQALKDFRKKLNVATTFNMLGPLLNPAHAAHYILGVADGKILPIMADVLKQTGCKRSIVVHGMGLDEISTAGPVKIIEINNGKKIEYCIDPLNFGLARCHISDLQGGVPMHNAQLLLEAFKGKPGPIADTLVLNAAVALYICGRYSSMADAVTYATHILKSGCALQLLNNWRAFSHEK